MSSGNPLKTIKKAADSLTAHLPTAVPALANAAQFAPGVTPLTAAAKLAGPYAYVVGKGAFSRMQGGSALAGVQDTTKDTINVAENVSGSKLTPDTAVPQAPTAPVQPVAVDPIVLARRRARLLAGSMGRASTILTGPASSVLGDASGGGRSTQLGIY